MIVYHIEVGTLDDGWVRLYEGLSSRQDATDIVRAMVDREQLAPFRRLRIVEDKQYGN